MAIQFKKAEEPKPKRRAGKPKRGRPALGKVRISILIDADTLEKFKAGGPGYQNRMNEALRKAIL